MPRFLVIIFLLVSTSSPVSGQQQDRSRPETLRTWKLAFVRDNNVWVSNGDGTDQRPVIENGQSPAWSPDKSQIAFVRQNNIWVAKADGSEQRPVTSRWKEHGPNRARDSVDAGICISWHPRNGSLTFSHHEAFKLERTDSAGIAPIPRKTAGDYIVGSSIFDVLLSGTEPGRVTVRYDVLQGGTTFFFVDHAHPAWSATGKKLAFTRNGDIWIAEAEIESEGEPPTGWNMRRLAAVASYDEPTNRSSTSTRGATRLSWHPGERLLAYSFDRLGGSGFNQVHVLDTVSGKDSVIVEDARDPCFSPDGRFVVYWAYGDKRCRSGGICVCAATLDRQHVLELVANGKDPVW
jgi:dipeptidyl aminopeptidase/acylaminoacyl peptidase